MTSFPTVSVVITTFNYATFVVEAIESVLAQTRQADEIIVVDDGSTDRTFELIAPYVERRQIRYVCQENQGPSAARNLGIHESSGDLLAFLDADDTWMPNKLQRQLDWLACHPDAVMVSGQKVWWNVERNTRRVDAFAPMSQARLRREITVRNVVGNPSMALIRRRAIDRTGPFDTSLRWGEDWDLFVRLSRAGEIGFVPEPVIVYRWHRKSLSQERGLKQLATNHVVGRRAVAAFAPAWQRPILRARVWSAIEYDRALFVNRQGASRIRRVRHAALALLSWPLDDTAAKAGLLGRATVGDARYQRVLAGVRGYLRRTRVAG